jgi:predicted nucleic acid-binding protein
VRVLLDTNAVSALLRGDVAVARPLRNASEIVFSTVVVGELLHGYGAGKRYDKNLSVLRRFLSQPFVDLRDVGFETAETYGRRQRELQAEGTPIPTNDVWIAAQGIETGAELWSFDAHFSAIRGLFWRQLR